MKADAKYHLTQFVHKETLSGRIVYLSLLFNDKKMSVFCLVYNFLFETWVLSRESAVSAKFNKVFIKKVWLKFRPWL